MFFDGHFQVLCIVQRIVAQNNSTGSRWVFTITISKLLLFFITIKLDQSITLKEDTEEKQRQKERKEAENQSLHKRINPCLCLLETTGQTVEYSLNYQRFWFFFNAFVHFFVLFFLSIKHFAKPIFVVNVLKKCYVSSSTKVKDHFWKSVNLKKKTCQN